MKEILIILMFIVPVFASAQEYGNLTSKDSLNINMDSSQVVVDSIVEANLKKEQITAIGGIPFGISREKALPVLRNKYGEEDYLSGNKHIVFKNIKYAGVDFNSVYFLFQSDGINSYFNACIFILNAKTKKEAIDKQDEMRALLSKKYNLSSFTDDNGFNLYVGGVSPLWNGSWKSFLEGNYTGAVHIDIINYDEELAQNAGFEYSVRIIYGPFNYVKEEF